MAQEEVTKLRQEVTYLEVQVKKSKDLERGKAAPAVTAVRVHFAHGQLESRGR